MLTITSVSHMSEEQLERLEPSKPPEKIQLFFDNHARDRGLPPLIVYRDPETDEFVGLSRPAEAAIPGTWVGRLEKGAGKKIDKHGHLKDPDASV